MFGVSVVLTSIKAINCLYSLTKLSLTFSCLHIFMERSRYWNKSTECHCCGLNLLRYKFLRILRTKEVLLDDVLKHKQQRTLFFNLKNEILFNYRKDGINSNHAVSCSPQFSVSGEPAVSFIRALGGIFLSIRCPHHR